MHGKNYSLYTYYNSVLIFTLSCQVAELSERLTTSLTMKRSRKLSRSGWRDRQKISILVEFTICQKKCRKCIELSGDYIEKQGVVYNDSILG